MTDEYRDTTKRVRESRHHNISHSIGMNEAFQYFKKYRKDIDSTMFRKTVKLINSLLQEQLADGEDIHLPQRMGYLELRKFPTKVEFIDGKLKTNLPIDWNKTLELWYNNPAAKEKKTKVRVETEYIYRVLYKKTAANYNNKTFYEFSTNRELKKALKRNIEEKKVDAFILKRKTKWKQSQ